MTRQTRCIDCNAEGRNTARAALRPGPRCEEHDRARKRLVAKQAHASRIENVYGINSVEYEAIYQAQGGKCFICQRATGKTKRLAVDHDHACTAGHDPKMGCRNCIRALLCGPCNKLIGILDVPALERAITVLRDRPAQQTLRDEISWQLTR